MNREKLAFVFIGLLLFILGFDALMIVHYVKNLSGPSLIAVASILAGTFLAIYAAWFCCKPNASKPLKLAAFVSKIVLIIVGGLSATAIITLYFHQKAQAAATEAVNLKDATQGQTQIAVIQAQSAATAQQMEARSRQIAQIEATAGNLQKTLGRAAARKFVEEEMAKLPPIGPSATPTPTPDLLATAQAVNEAEVKKEEQRTVKAWLLEYADSGVYYVPTIANLAVFIGLCAFLMFGRTTDVQSPVQSPVQFASSHSQAGFVPATMTTPAAAPIAGFGGQLPTSRKIHPPAPPRPGMQASVQSPVQPAPQIPTSPPSTVPAPSESEDDVIYNGYTRGEIKALIARQRKFEASRAERDKLRADNARREFAREKEEESGN